MPHRVDGAVCVDECSACCCTRFMRKYSQAELDAVLARLIVPETRAHATGMLVGRKSVV